MKQTPHRIMHDSLLSIGRSAAWPLFMRAIDANSYESSHVWEEFGVAYLMSMDKASDILLSAFCWDEFDEEEGFWEDIHKELEEAGL